MFVRRFVAFEKQDFDKMAKEISLLKSLLTVNNPKWAKQYSYLCNVKGFSPGVVNNILKDVPKTLKFFLDSNNYFLIPRGFRGYPQARDLTVKGEEVDLKDSISLRDYQTKPVDVLVSNQADILVSDTGSGKTVMAIEAIRRIGKTTCVVVNSILLANQWYDRFVEFGGIMPGRMYGKCKYNGEPVCISTVQSLLNLKYSENREFYDRFGVAVFDEVHRYGGLSFRKVIDCFPAHRRIGLTATVDRNDKFNIFKWSVGDRVFTVKQSHDTPVEIYVVKTGFTFLSSEFGEYLKEIIANRDRNARIIRLVNNMFKKNRRILVLSYRIDHVRILYEMYVSQNDSLFQYCIFPYSAKKKRDSDETRLVANSSMLFTDEKDLRVIFAGYKLLGEGVDLPQFNTMILTTPFKDPIQCKQIPGRLKRGDSGNIVFDLVDRDPKAESYYRQRLINYMKFGLKVSGDLSLPERKGGTLSL
jgi:superfamily II DNA or RNA helicase